ncbi:MAG: M14 family metallopeptidase [Pseudobdellovibrio sp.]
MKRYLFISLFFNCISALSQTFPNKNVQAYFKETYEESRQQFLESLESLKKQNNLSISAQFFPDPENGSLTTDTAYIKSSKAISENLVVIMSGLHGIEGFVGSAIQNSILNSDFILKNKHTDFLFIHALNPYGFKNKRRVNRFNIDLNRNFLLTEKDFNLKNAAYTEINYFLNPNEIVNLNILSRYGFILSSIKLILQYSLETLREAILKGQYEYNKGLYYGGNKNQYQKQIIDELYSSIILKYQKSFIIDIHTGYGERNKLHILANSMNQPSATTLNKIFTATRIDYGDQKKFYKTTGDLIGYLEAKTSSQNQISGVTFEFGTLDSQKTLGSIESLRRMVLENQNFNYPNTPKETVEVTALFQDMFNPADEFFRKQAVEKAQEELFKITTFLKK